MQKLIILLITCLSMAFATIDTTAAPPKRNAQSVKKERRAAAGEVERTRKEIKQNTAETHRMLNRLSSLTAEAERSEKAIVGLNSRIAELDSQIIVLDDTISKMEHSLSILKSAYAENLRAIRTRRQQMSTLAMIFSSRNFTEAYRRYRYMQQFDVWQKNKTEQIGKLSTEIAGRRDTVKSARNQQADNLLKLTEENTRLKATRAETEDVVNNLKKQGSNLQKALSEKQQQLKKLDQELDRIIAEEARIAEEKRRAEEARLAAEAKKKAEEAKKAAEAKNKTEGAKTSANTAENIKPEPPKKTVDAPKLDRKKPSETENIALTGSFESNKGKMPFPVSGKHSIVSHFGLNSHPDVSTVQVNNSGIDIETSPGTTARAVFDGEVSSVFHVSGYRNVVMLRHGNYLTVYAGIDSLSVKKGDKVKAGTTLGTIYSDPEDGNRTVLHFEVRRERAKLNPEDWVK